MLGSIRTRRQRLGMRAPGGPGWPFVIALLWTPAASVAGQEPAAWGDVALFHTFSIAAADPRTGETGVAVTTRVPCVGNGVPWVRAGVGAVATQAWTRVEYGPEILDLLARGSGPAEALAQGLAADTLAERRQVGVVSADGRSAQHTGTELIPWAGHYSGPNYAAQGNLLVGRAVVDSVASTFERSEGSPRHLADRLIEALAAGQRAGGDARKGRLQSAAVVVADPREGRSRRPDGITVHINVCEDPAPVAQLRRIYDTISQTLGYRTLQQFSGGDVWQLKVILNALDYFRRGQELTRDGDAFVFTVEAMEAVESFRRDQGLSTPEIGSPRGLVDRQTVDRLWAELGRRKMADEVKERLLEVTAVRR